MWWGGGRGGWWGGFFDGFCVFGWWWFVCEVGWCVGWVLVVVGVGVGGVWGWVWVWVVVVWVGGVLGVVLFCWGCGEGLVGCVCGWVVRVVVCWGGGGVGCMEGGGGVFLGGVVWEVGVCCVFVVWGGFVGVFVGVGMFGVVGLGWWGLVCEDVVWY
uniref:Uncharacterized protein n=1 Tax=Knipowitschia caucasica TaxID=637954 RepID=A0AAV2LPW0_KNICA